MINVKTLLSLLKQLPEHYEVTARTIGDTGNLALLDAGKYVGYIEVDTGTIHLEEADNG